MSAFVVNDDHIRLIAQAHSLYGEAIGYIGTLDEYCTTLLRENVASVNHRYSEDYATRPIEYHPVWFEEDPIRFKVQVLEAIHCLNYQSCEHDGWETSIAKFLIDRLHDIVRALVPLDRVRDRNYPEAPCDCLTIANARGDIHWEWYPGVGQDRPKAVYA